MMKLREELTYYNKAVLNSYAILFFSQHRIFGALLLVASLFHVNAGLIGLAAVIISLLLVKLLGFSKEIAQSGLYSFNSLLLGIGFGTFFSINVAFWIWLAIALLLCLILSINLTAYLGKYGLPILSIPFVLIFWLVLIATNGYDGMGLMQKDSSIVFELYTGSAIHFYRFNDFIQFHLPDCLSLFFRSLSAVIFQNNVLAGILVALGLLLHSRIALSLLVIGFFFALFINYLTGTYQEGISNYHLGANFMMMSLAMGGFFLIPSIRSYIWAIAAVAIMFLMVNGLSRILEVYNLPILSMPFSLLTISLLYFFMLRINPGKLQITSIQNYSPETNLYQFLNGQERLKDFKYLPLNLPFMGIWTVSQAYNGDITHKGDWSEALDFVITDLDQKTYEFPGNKPEHYYCFNKPVLATADGLVVEVIQHVDDNPIGSINMEQNWGNTIVIKHLDGLFSKVSHLKKNSAKVKQGDYVKQGDIIALCGNSGRSPEPHLHFQLQTTPYIGSKTLAYPISYYQKTTSTGESNLQYFEIPKMGDLLQSVEINPFLKHAFHFEPGYQAEVKTVGRVETWEVFTDAFNQTYLYCKENQSIAYFVKNNNVFYFSRFYGNQKSLLYLFYLAAYKINFSSHDVVDTYATNSEIFNPQLWLQDLAAPFWIFRKTIYRNQLNTTSKGINISATAKEEGFGKNGLTMEADLLVTQSGLEQFTIKTEKLKNSVTCEIKSI